MTVATDTGGDVPRPRGDESRLFGEHHDRLLRNVRRAVNASDALIEDACSFAWVQLLRRQPDRGPMLFGWLRTTAIREAYRLCGLERRNATRDEFQTPGNGEEHDALVANESDLDTRLEPCAHSTCSPSCPSASAAISRCSSLATATRRSSAHRHHLHQTSTSTSPAPAPASRVSP